MSEEALKPCPFCGGRAEFVFAALSRRGAVRCSICFSECRENVHGKARGVWGRACDAITAWNRRSGDVALVTGIADDTGKGKAMDDPSVEWLEDVLVRAQQYREAVGSSRPWERDFAEFIQHAIFTSKQEPPHACGVSEWISVKDKLPPEGQEVLIINDGKFLISARELESGDWESGTEPFLYWGHDYEIIEGPGVTHWMPLPEPPHA